MRKPVNNKIKTVQINVMDNHTNLDDLKINAKASNTGNETVDTSIEDMKNLLANLKKPVIVETVEEVDITENDISSQVEIIQETEKIEEETVSEIVEDIKHENDIQITETIQHENDISLTDEEIVYENPYTNWSPGEGFDINVDYETYVKENTYIFDIYADFVDSHFIHRHIKIRNNEKIKIVIDGHYHNHNKINSWLKSPFNLYIDNNIIFSFYGNIDDNTTEIENVILFRDDYVFINGKCYSDTNLTISHI